MKLVSDLGLALLFDKFGWNYVGANVLLFVYEIALIAVLHIFLDNFVKRTGKVENCVLFTGGVCGFDIKAMREDVQGFL
jgi:hypothetical protein